MGDFEPRRYLTRRKLSNASSAEQRYKNAVLEAGAELAHEFSEHYWKDFLQKGGSDAHQATVSPITSESIMKGFLFYLNASGRYLVLREHLRSAISGLVQQKCLNLRPSGFHNHRDLQAYLHDMYVYLVDEMHEILNASTLQETDRLVSNMDRLLQQTNCEKDKDLTKLSLQQRHITDLAIFAEEAFAQGDFESCHKLHLQRTCKDKESARCWTEFAIMWLSRGNIKMAEIAAREALAKDPLYLYALLIAGIIAVQQGNPGGLDCLNKALELKQMSPEILVILGVANSMTGNEEAADDFFRKAAHVHRVLTGRRTEGLDKIFTDKNRNRAFSIKEFVNDMENSPHPSRNASLSMDPSTLPNGEDVSKIPSEETQQVKRRSKNGSNAGRLSKDDMTQLEKAAAENAAVKKKRRTSGRNSTILGGDPPRPDSVSNVVKDGSNLSLKKKRRSSGRKSGGGDELSRPDSSSNKGSKGSLKKRSGSARNSAGSAVNIDEPEPPTSNSKYNVTLADIQPEDVKLSLIPSILSPWDVTEYSQKMERHLKTVDYLESTPSGSRKSSRNSNNAGPFNVIPSDEDIAPDSQIKEEYEKLIDSRKSSKASRTSKDEVRKLSRRGTAESDMNKEPGEDGASVGKLSTQSVKEDLEVEPQIPSKVSNRLGSELIWAANLLVNLRLFDFVDGVLSKHLFFYGSRTLQFLYLRAVSLYLRKREVEALEFIKEAIELDDPSGIFWSLEGHCYYNQNNIEEAMTSYEKALKAPHINENRHLLYLRYGSLVLDNGNTKLAKKVFLHGVSKHPTPFMWLALGNVCFQRKEYDQAESAFSEANRLDNMNPISWGHLTLCSLLQNKKELAEQSYKWAIRFGLKKGPLFDEIQKVQKEKGFGDPSFPRLPNCVPHDYFLRRMGKVKPFNLYKEGLDQSKPRFGADRYADTEHELLMKAKLSQMAAPKVDESEYLEEEEWEGEDAVDLEPIALVSSPSNRSELNEPNQSIGRINTGTPPDLLANDDLPPPAPPSSGASRKSGKEQE